MPEPAAPHPREETSPTPRQVSFFPLLVISIMRLNLRCNLLGRSGLILLSVQRSQAMTFRAFIASFVGRPSRARSIAVVSVWLFLLVHPLSGQEVARHRWPVKILERLLVPFRSSPFLQSSMSPCGLGFATCFASASTVPARTEFEFKLAAEDSHRPVMLELRADHGGPLGHQWLELESRGGGMTIGFGPATLPFIDSGQISLQDRHGNIKWISGMHPLPWLALPPVKYHYARSPGEGRAVGKPISLTVAQADALIGRLQHLKFVGPYIPIFHDCHTFTCAVLTSAQGHSTLPCYLLFKGQW
jgi:hypothetical protein